jgi:putative transposase
VVNRSQKRQATQLVLEHLDFSERRACMIVGLPRSVYRYQSIKRDDTEIREGLRQLAFRYKRYGYRRLTALLNLKTPVNHKRVYRIYCEEGLKIRRKRTRRKGVFSRSPLVIPKDSNQRWSMDFVSDTAGQRRIRTLNVIDDCTRESLAIEVDTSISGERVTRVLERIALRRQLPRQIVVDNGPEFTSRAFLRWSITRNIDIHFIDKGKPTQNAFIESFNGKFRDECLNQFLFADLREARLKIEAWRVEYNTQRPHSSLGYLTPESYAKKIAG